MLARMSSTAPRPFMANPMIADCRRLLPKKRATRPAPTTFPIIAAARMEPRKASWVVSLRKAKSTWKPSETKNIGPRKL